MDGKFLGKITRATFGKGGYQDVQFGVTFTLETTGGSVVTGKWEWRPEQVTPNDRSQWNESDRSDGFDKIMRFVSKTMHEAGVDDFYNLIGVPVEVEFKDNTIKSWRILTEVL